MLKKVVYHTLVLVSLVGCSSPQYIVPSPVYVPSNRTYQQVIIETPYCRQQYEQRAIGCDQKFRNDPNFARLHYGACINQAKEQWNTCTGYK
jgi:hypothetical protein